MTTAITRNKSKEISIAKPEQISISSHVDDRGFLCQIFGNYEDRFPKARRIYVVGNFSKGTIRGFHKHEEEWKCYFVSTGSAKFIVVAEGKKEKSVYILSSRNPSVLVVPPRYFHGWMSLEDGTILIGISNKSLEESLCDDVRIDPFSYGKEMWEVKAR